MTTEATNMNARIFHTTWAEPFGGYYDPETEQVRFEDFSAPAPENAEWEVTMDVTSGYLIMVEDLRPQPTPEPIFVAATPHPINILIDGEKRVLPAMENAPRIQQDPQPIGEIAGLTIQSATRGQIVNLPEPREGVIYLMGVFYHGHPDLQNRDDIYLIDTQRGVQPDPEVKGPGWITRLISPHVEQSQLWHVSLSTPYWYNTSTTVEASSKEEAVQKAVDAYNANWRYWGDEPLKEGAGYASPLGLGKIYQEDAAY